MRRLCLQVLHLTHVEGRGPCPCPPFMLAPPAALCRDLALRPNCHSHANVGQHYAHLGTALPPAALMPRTHHVAPTVWVPQHKREKG